MGPGLGEARGKGRSLQTETLWRAQRARVACARFRAKEGKAHLHGTQHQALTVVPRGHWSREKQAQGPVGRSGLGPTSLGAERGLCKVVIFIFVAV